MGLYDDIMNTPASGKGNVSVAPSSKGLFDDIMARPSPANNQSVKSELNSPNEFVDAASSFGTGLAKGYAGMAGLPGTIQSVARMAPWAPKRSMLDAIAEKVAGSPNLPTSAETIAAAGKVIPAIAEKPMTNAGRYAETVGEFYAGGGPRNSVSNAIVPGIATEFTQQQVDKGALPKWATPAAAVTSSILSHGTSKVLMPASSAEEIIQGATKNVTSEQLDAAEKLMSDARGQGVNLTRAEALQQVTGGATNLGNVQRVVEGQGALTDFMGQRPDQIRQANEAMFSNIAETPSNPSSIGPRVGEAASGIIGDTTKDINARTAPRYKAAEGDVVPANDMAALGKDKIFSDTLKEIRSDPTLNKTVAHLPDDSPVVLDLVQRRMGEVADNAMMPGQATTSNTRAGNIGSSRETVRNVADAASPELSGARQTQEVLRDLHLKPLMEGPIGKLAGKDTTTKAAIDALFPQNPTPNSAGEVLSSVKALSDKNPWAARQVVRSHIESVFNQASKDLQSGANEFGGAGFRSKLIGNKQQAENLAAAITALPGGENIRKGFDRLMDIMEATGQRQRIGSQTAFNQEALSALKNGGTLAEAISTGGIKLPQKISEKFAAWNMGKNVDEIARLLTDPDAADAFKKLALANNYQKMASATLRLTSIGMKARNRENR